MKMIFKFTKDYVSYGMNEVKYKKGDICDIINGVVFSKSKNRLFKVDSRAAGKFGIICPEDEEISI